MTVSTTNLTFNSTGDGTTLTFPFSFDLQQSTDLEVFLNNILQTTGYTVNINSNNVGGSVVFTTAPASGVAIFGQRVLAITQALTLTNEGDVPSLALTNALDKLTMIDQQVQFSVSLALSLPASAAGTVSLVLPAPVASNFLQWNSTATALINTTLSTTSTLGPGTTTVNALAIWNSTNGSLLGQLSSLGTSGQVLTSQGTSGPPQWANPTVSGSIPAGLIAPFYTTYGGSIPTGWAVCDGTNGTPNIIGTPLMPTQLGSVTPPAAGYGTQSNNTIVGTNTHVHVVVVSGSGSGVTSGESSDTVAAAGTGNTIPQRSHTHGFSVGVTSSGTSNTQSVGGGSSNIPVSFAIVHIMKL